MMDTQRPPIKNCPVCCVAMIAEEIPDRPQHLNYYCPGCGSDIRYTSPDVVIDKDKGM